MRKNSKSSNGSDQSNPFSLSKTAKRSNQKVTLDEEHFDQKFEEALERVKSNNGSKEPKKFMPKSKKDKSESGSFIESSVPS